MGYPVKQGQTARPLLFKLYSATDHLAGATGKTPTVTLSKNGGAFASPAGAVTEVGRGWYKVAGNATDASALGPLVLNATATGCDECDDVFEVVAFDPEAAAGLGLTYLDAAVTSRGTGAALDAAGVRSAVGLASANLDTQLAALFTTAMTESYAADGAAPTPAQALFLIQQRLTEFAISGTSITVKKLDGSTTAATLTLDDATAPTSSTRAS